MKITVIVPVYNVAAYIDQCLASIAGQTFTDFEALLIDDGSTDASGEICGAQAAADPRFRVIRKENGGVSSARNLGIEEARGEYLAFVDPDDWLDPRYLEKLYLAASGADADIAECDIWRYNDRNGQKIHRPCWGTTGVPWTLAEHMKYGSTATYKSVSRRELWIRNGVRLPDCAFESPAVYALLLALADRVVNVREPLYYYRRFRPESLIETGYAYSSGRPNNTLGIEAMRHLLSEFKRLGLYEHWQNVLEGVVKYRLSDILATQFHRKSERDYRETAANFRAFLCGAFPQSHNEAYVTFGGYNLNRILVHMDLLHDPACRFNFSGLISLAGTGSTDESIDRAGGDRLQVRHPNRYREIMVQREEDLAIWQILKETQPAFFFIDLIEERFDVQKRGGRYITLSDARAGCLPGCGACRAPEADGAKDAAAVPEEEIFRFGSRSREALFREACGRFFDRIRKTVPGIRIVIVENYLCEQKGSLQPGPCGDADRPAPVLQDFEDAAEIRKANRVLETYYGILSDACPDAVRIVPRNEPAIKDLLFTDTGYEYGVVPSHLNEYANRRIAALIGSRLDEDRG